MYSQRYGTHPWCIDSVPGVQLCAVRSASLTCATALLNPIDQEVLMDFFLLASLSCRQHHSTGHAALSHAWHGCLSLREYLSCCATHQPPGRVHTAQDPNTPAAKCHAGAKHTDLAALEQLLRLPLPLCHLILARHLTLPPAAADEGHATRTAQLHQHLQCWQTATAASQAPALACAAAAALLLSDKSGQDALATHTQAHTCRPRSGVSVASTPPQMLHAPSQPPA